MSEPQPTAEQFKSIRNRSLTSAAVMAMLGFLSVSMVSPQRKSDVKLQEEFFRAAATDQVIEQTKPVQSAVDLAFERASSGVTNGSVSFDVSGNVDIGKAIADMPAKQTAYEDEFQKQQMATYAYLLIPGMFAAMSLVSAAGAHARYKKLTQNGPS